MAEMTVTVSGWVLEPSTGAWEKRQRTVLWPDTVVLTDRDVAELLGLGDGLRVDAVTFQRQARVKYEVVFDLAQQGSLTACH